ncbi:4566_t:CDS:2 [Funneliformis caledonium]|uniref:4566_t:CDS:1 n=1 Tax=Funneliformis caledonium TaxID=1117310 RepID=A0A9N9FZM7_9GLOM|nr:4566_t:CDS:2 [Funneliformis caledonium]
MPAKFTLICIIHSIIERDTTEHIIPLFSDGNILRFTGKFALPKDPHDTIKLNVTEFARSSQGGPTGRTFCIKCRYLKSNRRIEKKATRIRKNSNLMITGKMIHTNKTLEYIVEIQDINFFPMSIAMNIESPTGESVSSLYSWPAEQSSGRISAQAMASVASNTQSSSSSVTSAASNTQSLSSNKNPQPE